MSIITPIYAAILAIIFVALSLRIIKTRRQNNISLGDAANTKLQRAIRAQGNFAEYVPLALILLGYVEILQYPQALLHALAASLVLGRLLHAWGISNEKENFKFRVAGMMLTFVVLLGSSALILLQKILL